VVVTNNTIQDSRLPADQRPPARARVRAFLQRTDGFEAVVLGDDPGSATDELGAGDLDGDGDADLVVSRVVGRDIIPRVLWNDAGHFTGTDTTRLILEQSPLVVDADGDGRADIVGGTTYLHNDGNRAFSATPLVPNKSGD
jgi:hypothetical protein